ncbi:sensor histidine kinase [Actinoplanes sp. G11-F43]|uniref:sensor histidine kinase n=1 Tax=Actinoplanes sp. G11-F43 TaxID=3424130 RepID=UPI003D329336
MARWTLPLLLVLGQLLYWPGMLLMRGDPVPVLPATGVAVASLIMGAGLLIRRERPVPALAVVIAGGVLGLVTAPAEQQWLVEHDAMLIIWFADMVALFSVAVHTPARTTWYALAVVIAWESVLTGCQEGVDTALPLSILLTGVICGVVAAFGRRRARWNAARTDAARRLAAAQRAEREAADDERRRLARELHDVTAHHLTSIVVNSSAAEMLGDQRPDLRSEALDFAARTGRETLDALHRLVAIMPAAATTGDQPALADLTEGFRALGQRITLDLPDGEPAPELAPVVYGIAREALTNTLRYASGGEVLVRWSGGELTVEDDGGGAGLTTAGLGGGRGVDGMRERAASVGGTCDAGPRDGGGWRVRAVLAGGGGTDRHAYRKGPLMIDALLVAIVILAQSLGLGLAVGEGLTPAVAVPALIGYIVHALPLFFRRRAPWGVFAATVLTGLLFPLLVVTGAVPSGLGYVFVFGCAAELAAVHTVAARAAGPAVTWLSIPAAGVPWGLTMALLLGADTAGDPEMAAEGPMLVHGMVVVLTPVLAVVLAVPAVICWSVGHSARRRRDRRHAQEEGGVALALEQAAFRAMLERHRIAAGLHEAVLRHAADVPGAAERGDISGVLAAARKALTAMRSLLDREVSKSASSE